MKFWAAKLADFDTQLYVQDSVSGLSRPEAGSFSLAFA